MPEFNELVVGFVITMLRVYLIYWITMGIYEVKKVGVQLWTLTYVLGAGIYMAYTSLSSLGVDAVHPLRIVALIGGILFVKVLVLALRKKNHEGE